jgi:hypothetical protein
MKLADAAFALTLTAMLLASIAAVLNVGPHWRGEASHRVPMFQLERVVITGPKPCAAPS